MTGKQSILRKIEEVKTDILNLEAQVDYKSGIVCPKCGSFNNVSADSRRNKSGFKIRKRKCVDCGNRWSTIEIFRTQKFEDCQGADANEEEVKH